MVTVVNMGMLNGYSCKSVKIIDLRGVKACVLLKFTDFFKNKLPPGPECRVNGDTARYHIRKTVVSRITPLGA
jgi:hypothetical protein